MTVKKENPFIVRVIVIDRMIERMMVRVMVIVTVMERMMVMVLRMLLTRWYHKQIRFSNLKHLVRKWSLTLNWSCVRYIVHQNLYTHKRLMVF